MRKSKDAQGSLLYGPLNILKQFQLIDCKHSHPKPASPCLRNMIGESNENQYFIGTRDSKLGDYLNKIPGVPSLFLINNTIVLDTPSKFSKRNAEEKLEVKKKPSEHQQSILQKLKIEAFGEQEEQPRRKRKKIKGPNPLSCKPKKKRKIEIQGLRKKEHGNVKEQENELPSRMQCDRKQTSQGSLFSVKEGALKNVHENLMEQESKSLVKI